MIWVDLPQYLRGSNPDHGTNRFGAPGDRREPSGAPREPGTPRVARVLRVGHDVARAAEAGTHGRAGPVDHRFDAARPVQEDGQQVVELDAGRVRRLERHRVLDRHPLVEVGVAAHPVTLERRDAARHVERRVAVLGGTGHPRRLAGHLVGVLVLEEDHLAALPVPDRLVLLVVLHGQAVGGDVVAVDHDTGRALVRGPRARTGAVVGPPGPHVIDDRVVAVVDEAGRGRARLGPADPEEHVVDRDGSLAWLT